MRITSVIDIREILRRLREGDSDRQAAEAVGLVHKTIGRYREWATGQGFLVPDVALPDMVTLAAAWKARQAKIPKQNQTSLAGHAETILALRKRGLSAQVVLRELREKAGYTGSYSSLSRYLRQQEGPAEIEVTVRVETAPGEEAQVDFGDAGEMWDPLAGRPRRAWMFVMTLSWSRHQFVGFVFDQKVETWLNLHERGFEFFGGVPARIKPDNLKAAVVRASYDDPLVQRAYREFAEHWGFLIDPCRVRTPQHKGKVEAGVKYVDGNFISGRDYTRADSDVNAANRDALVWVRETAGTRTHGTTRQRPLEQFEATERAALKPLPETGFEIASWRAAKLQRDCYLTIDNAYYSVPYRHVGKTLMVRVSARQIRVYAEHVLIATHTRATQAGERITNEAHLPEGKRKGMRVASPLESLSRAEAIGPRTTEVVQGMLGDTALDRRRSVERLLNQVHKYGAPALEQACVRAIESGDPTAETVRNWLKIGARPLPMASPWLISAPDISPPPIFARPANELLPASAFCESASLVVAFESAHQTSGEVVLPCN